MQGAIEQSSFELINLKLRDFKILEQLPMHHKDPFDRIIIAQAIAEGFQIITSDRIFEKYPVKVLKI